MTYSVYQASRVGGRKNNEDRVGYVYGRDIVLLVLADGMGGHAYGEVASQIFVQVLVKMFEAQAKPHLEDVPRFMLDAIFAAHEAVNEHAAVKGWSEPPRTTCIVCVVQHDRASWAHVGDSRLYHFSQERLLSRTRDHTLMQQMLDKGLIDERRAAQHPDRNKLYNCVGGHVLPQVELSREVRLRDGDVVLLSSDGFWSQLTDTEMLATFRAFSLERSVEYMMDHAEVSGGEHGDNLSVVALRFHAPNAGQAAEPEVAGLDGFTTQLFNAEGGAGNSAMSDDEIDQAIADIQSALRKFDLKTGK